MQRRERIAVNAIIASSTQEASAEVSTEVTCSNCAAICCKSEVLLLTDTGVPARYIASDEWGSSVMLRLDDGWCAALDRNSMLCTIYEKRPLICREFEMGASDCIAERAGLATVYQSVAD